MACRSLQPLDSLHPPASRTDPGRQTQTCPARIKRRHEVRKDTTADRRPAKKKRKATSERSLEADAKSLKGQSPEPRAESAEGVQTLSSSSSSASLCSAHGGWTISAADFLAIYQPVELLGEGGYGSVYAGYRIEDHLPVAIKQIEEDDVICTPKVIDGKLCQFPLEVELLLKAGAGAGPSGSSAAVMLLDWFFMEDKLVLVMERPDPSTDLENYLADQGGALHEDEAKILMRQLVDAAIEIHARGVFHRDLKPQNILVETESLLPRVRLIDFGCGDSFHEGSYSEDRGTFFYTPPEMFRWRCYSAGPTTVWQLGVVLYEMLTSSIPFATEYKIVHSDLDSIDELSQDCQDFLRQCLAKSPERRLTLEQMRLHPWMC
ncbi:serine/threonine-protein kinase pim-2-like [Myripristis murdjan]|uniref:serine/threonine-protein kinase pim-2-like n=1 Tax=Myripristis murdjan TaxID=586833 RepID=UPI00117615C5|nr:serine/threonine-protein kinase pim-2-like [Myripristis murdjan]